MGRHSPRLSPARRLAAAALGIGTVLALGAGVWFVGAGTDPEARIEAAATTSTTVTEADPTTTSLVTTSSTDPPTTTSPPTTAAAGTTNTTESTTTTTTLAPLIMEADGLSVVALGATEDEALAEIGARLGTASSDSGWVNARGNFGTCPGNVVRVVRWASLRAFFSDGPTDFGEEGRHFFYYSQSSVETDTIIDLTTAEGIGIGSTVEELEDAYGNRVSIESTARFGVTFTIESDDRGLLSGALTESVDTGQVTLVGGGFGCGD